MMAPTKIKKLTKKNRKRLEKLVVILQAREQSEAIIDRLNRVNLQLNPIVEEVIEVTEEVTE